MALQHVPIEECAQEHKTVEDVREIKQRQVAGHPQQGPRESAKYNDTGVQHQINKPLSQEVVHDE